MRSQCAILLLTSAGAACTGTVVSPVVSHLSLPGDSADLSLQRVAFARLSDGRLSARGTAAHLDYRRVGGLLVATGAAATIVPEPGSGLSAYGLLHVSAPVADVEIATRRGNGTGARRK